MSFSEFSETKNKFKTLSAICGDNTKQLNEPLIELLEQIGQAERKRYKLQGAALTKIERQEKQIKKERKKKHTLHNRNYENRDKINKKFIVQL